MMRLTDRRKHRLEFLYIYISLSVFFSPVSQKFGCELATTDYTCPAARRQTPLAAAPSKKIANINSMASPGEPSSRCWAG
jgi:hypothetical protein